MPGERFESDSGFDDQDQSEAFDEEMTVGADRPPTTLEVRAFEDLPDVEDVTRAVGDRDDDEALALDADEFDPELVGEADFEEDDELDYRAATSEHEDDLDGLGSDASDIDPPVSRTEIDGLDTVRDGAEAQGGEDDFTDFSARDVSDEDLKRMGYAEDRNGATTARPDRG
jgi:hypothetical protein